MSEDTEVKFARDNGSKRQWATGIFYRKDGCKRTLAPKPLLGFLGGFFLLGIICIFLQDSPTPQTAGKTQFKAEDQLTQGESHDIAEYQYKIGESYNPEPTTANVTRPPKKPIRYSGLQVVARATKLVVPPGLMVKAKLLSGASNGPVRAKLLEDIEVNGDILMDAGAIVVGNGNSTEERLMIRFNQLVAGAKVHQIQAQACDLEDQVVGLKGSTVGNHALKLAAGIGLNFAGGASMALQESDVKGGVEVKKPSMKNALLNGAAQASLEQARSMMSDLKSQQPVIEVPAEQEFYLMFQGAGNG
jgi:hypothetical protein